MSGAIVSQISLKIHREIRRDRAEAAFCPSRLSCRLPEALAIWRIAGRDRRPIAMGSLRQIPMRSMIGGWVSLMEIKIMDLPTIAVIGKEGLCTAGRNIVQQLWQEADAHFDEVAALGKKAPDGTYAAFWGAMSDESRSFRPWTHQFTRGLYLAGVETHVDAAAPEGWTKWVLPARKYIVVDVEPDRYGEIFDEVIQVTIPGKGMKLAGAVCDHTEPATGKSRLFFPVEPL